jgi:hypothetical protein
MPKAPLPHNRKGLPTLDSCLVALVDDSALTQFVILATASGHH